MSEGTFRNCPVLAEWHYQGRRCLLIDDRSAGAVLGVYDEPDPEAALELIPPAALLDIAAKLTTLCDSAEAKILVLDEELEKQREQKVTKPPRRPRR